MKLFPFFSFFLLFTCCENDMATTSVEKATVSTKKDSIADSSIDILIFKKEKKVELWENGKKNEPIFIKKMELVNGTRLLLGPFVSTSGKMELNLPDNTYNNKMNTHSSFLQHNLMDFSERSISIKDLISAKDQGETTDLLSNYQLNQVIIFPNDARLDGKFNPCINCPHWMVEIYGNLELQLKNYLIPNS